MEKDLQSVLKQLTLEEKASLCSGLDFWHLKGVERLNIPSIMVTDGPHGLRKQAGESDHIGIQDSVRTTCFPTASATASSWDVDLLHEMGQALGDECLQEQVSVLLGPGANIKRSPLCGRNFEYISEDPYQSGKLGAALVQGIQSKGIGTSLKHFVANNQEYRRMAIDAVVDERAFRELYLASFEHVVKDAQPWTVMCSYNRINGTYASDNKYVLTDILKEEWGHTGLVVTDWGACNDRVEGIKAGMELEMPASGGLNDKKIIEAVKNDLLTVADLDRVVIRLLDLISKSEDSLVEGYKCDMDAHHELARKVAGQSAVLLKNDQHILPLSNEKIAVIGEFARTPRYQGAGSSLINPTKIESAIDELDRRGIQYDFHPGYSTEDDVVDEAIIKAAVETAKKADVVLLYAGLTDDYESEGFDRSKMSMPHNHDAVIKAVSEACDKVVVVLQNGAPVEMPWIDSVSGILECYLGGQAGGPASIDLLFGDVNPSGKLAETIPVSLKHDVASQWFGMGPSTLEYRESIYVGYRYYDSADVKVQFPFGYGLSYTKFEYSNLVVSGNDIKDTDSLELSFTIKNVGDRAGAEIAQVYVNDVVSTIYRPKKELKAFKKVYLEPGEEKTVALTLDKRAFAYYNINIEDWHVESGEFVIMVGASSKDIKLTETVKVTSSNPDVIIPDYRESAPIYYKPEQLIKDIPKEAFEVVLGRKVPKNLVPKKGQFTINSTLEDISDTFVGKRIYKMVYKNFMKMLGDADPKQINMMKSIVNDMPVRSMVLMGGGMFNFKMADGLLMMMNGKFFKGLSQVVKHRK